MQKRFLRIFLDTSVLLAAFGSPMGGSALIINNQGTSYRCITSLDVIVEALSKAQKLNTTEEAIKKWILDKNIIIIQSPSEQKKACFNTIVLDRQDRHVVAAAVNCKADILLSLDRKHIVTDKIKNQMKDMSIGTPKDFLQGKF